MDKETIDKKIEELELDNINLHLENRDLDVRIEKLEGGKNNGRNNTKANN